MLTLNQKIRVAIGVLYLVLIHLAAVLDRPVAAVAAIAALAVAIVVSNLARRGPRLELGVWSITGVAMLGVLVAAMGGWADGAAIILFPPVLINLFLLYLFGRTLLPGREALIVHFSRLNFDGDVPPPLVTYGRRLTMIWTIFFAVFAAESAAFAMFADLETWSWVVNIANPFAALAFFVLEHVFRVFRYNRFGPFSLVRAVRIMMRPDAWVVGKC